MNPTNPVTPAPVTPVTPAAPVTPDPEEIKVSLDDLFTDDKKNVAPVVPAVVTPAPVTPPIDPNADPDKKILSDVEDKFKNFDQQVQQQIVQSTNQVTQKIERSNEVSLFFASEASEPFKPFQAEISKIANDPKFSGLKMERVIGLALGPTNLMKLGAKMAAAANNTARSNGSGGNANNAQVNNAQAKDYWGMSSEDFKAHQARVMQGQNK